MGGMGVHGRIDVKVVRLGSLEKGRANFSNNMYHSTLYCKQTKGIII